MAKSTATVTELSDGQIVISIPKPPHHLKFTSQDEFCGELARYLRIQRVKMVSRTTSPRCYLRQRVKIRL